MVKIPSVLRRFTGGAGEVPAEGASARAALESLFAHHPALRERVLDEAGALRPYLLLYVDGERATLDTAIPSKGTLEIVGAAEGG